MAERDPWTIESLLKWAADDFRAKGIDSPRLDAEVLLGWATGKTRIQLVIESKSELNGEGLARFREAVKRRRTREPVAYVLGQREFFGRMFRVDKRVLVPRPDTEALVEVTLERTRHLSMSMRALDLCTGSGCVGITLARERPTTQIVMTDMSAHALVVARENALRLGAYNLALFQGDLFAALREHTAASIRFDVIASNPPYIASEEIPALMADVRDFEPKLALDGGKDGLDLVRRIVKEAPAHLEKNGIVALEIGFDQAERTRAIFLEHGYADIETKRDYGKIERVISARWPG
ncbi:MAG: peptide chain release factor N(5)-glutamine methyltransferase, partial [Polyangiaceae bacterium]